MKKLLGFATVAWLLGKWWARDQEWTGGETDDGVPRGLREIELWVELPYGGKSEWVGTPVVMADGTPIGHVIGQDVKPPFPADPYPREVPRVKVRVDSRRLGWPITTAIAQAELFTRRSLGVE